MWSRDMHALLTKMEARSEHARQGTCTTARHGTPRQIPAMDPGIGGWHQPTSCPRLAHIYSSRMLCNVLHTFS